MQSGTPKLYVRSNTTAFPEGLVYNIYCTISELNVLISPAACWVSQYCKKTLGGFTFTRLEWHYAQVVVACIFWNVGVLEGRSGKAQASRSGGWREGSARPTYFATKQSHCAP